ncbi:uncharacterized protein [Sinocyclocheilus grahami]|uniref:uncharacterized protein n=1 Tax=Sinocyclocheilus grahami TaxID=75366 RepID=UPI0007AD0D98|nr:PREDICTED: uncharacterized protein LOC107566739 [Sinocyclocheilus grahami]
MILESRALLQDASTPLNGGRVSVLRLRRLLTVNKLNTKQSSKGILWTGSQSIEQRTGAIKKESSEILVVHQLQKMSSPNSEMSRNNNRYKNKSIITTAAPVSFLLLTFQGLMGIQFSCPCSNEWLNRSIAVLIFIVPALFGGIMLSLFLRFEEQTISGGGGFQTDSSESSKSEKCIYFMIRCIPPLLWFCIFFIDGDYFGCFMTNWNGQYTCDKNIHPNCVSWCKPESNKGKNETETYNYTQQMNNISKVIGYCLALLFCFILLIIMCMTKDKNRTSVPRVTETNPEAENAMMNSASE